MGERERERERVTGGRERERHTERDRKCRFYVKHLSSPIKEKKQVTKPIIFKCQKSPIMSIFSAETEIFT